ncbi:IscS subfamily cysteine desulfurase [Candidatus Pacearchaeota archaeon]|nr:IscS subfamily cysteine desulfurase [Candidatus Pacearchaeota archaeon]
MEKISLKEIYLDNAATTYTDKRVVDEMLKYMSGDGVYGNPGSFNTIGLKAKKALDDARQRAANILGCNSSEIIFTGSGTESINLALQGIARANMNSKKKHIITSKVEHKAVLETCEYLESTGFKVTYLDVDEFGLVKPEKLGAALTDETLLVSIMYANNEVGSVNNIPELVKVCKESGKKVLFHTDACQAAGYLDINIKNLGVDLMTINASKLYGPKGVGLLYIRQGVVLKPIIIGGGQERGLRSGTENVAGIVGFVKALEIAEQEKNSEVKRLTELRDYLIKNLMEKIPKVLLNGHPMQRLPNNANLSFIDVEGEAIMLMMNEVAGICASSGSACTSKTLDPSHVILALGRPYEVAHGSIRFTLGRSTTKANIDKVIEVLPGIIEKLREISPVNLKMEEVLPIGK